MQAQVDKPSLSVVVTVYTETVSVIETVERLLRSDGQASIQEIILIIAPRASAETKQICEDLARRYGVVKARIQQSGPGVGRGLREAMLTAAAHDCVAIMAGDLETEPEAVIRMYHKMLETGADVVIANRWLQGGGFQGYDPIKLVCNWFFQKIFQVIYLTRISDLTYGFKLLRSEVIRSVAWESDRHPIFIETTVKPLRLGYRLEQVPTVWIGRHEGESVNTFLRNFDYVKLALRVRARPAAAAGIRAPG
jgi:glycosyltransferase involved in cell wall biosynthesis